MDKHRDDYEVYVESDNKNQEIDIKNRLIERAKKEAEQISNDIDFIIEKIKTEEYDLILAKEELSWRVNDMERFYFSSDNYQEINEIYQEVLDKAKAVLKRVEDKIQEEGLDKL